MREGAQCFRGVWHKGEKTQVGNWVSMEWPTKGHWEEGEVRHVWGAEADWARVRWTLPDRRDRFGPHETWEERQKLWRYREP